MNIKKKYYKLGEKDFKKYLDNLKKDPDNITIFKEMDHSFFYYPSSEINNKLLTLHKLELEFNMLANTLSKDKQSMIKQSFIIDEIQSSNSTENIYSTKNDIFGISSSKAIIQNKKITSIVNIYNSIDSFNINDLYSLNKLRKLYDTLMLDAYENKNDIPDGKYFRKETVYITNGIQPIYQGFNPETKIIKGMEDVINVLKNKDIDIYLKILITHFMIETIHPFYDGNGRYGRLIMSLILYTNTKSLLSYKIATGINKQKTTYYNALEDARDIHEFGCLNDYISCMLDILIKEYKNTINSTKNKLTQISNITKYPSNLTKSEKIIYDLLKDATYLTYFGICNEEIINITGISKKTVIECFNKLNKKKLIVDYKLSKTLFHKLIIK